MTSPVYDHEAEQAVLAAALLTPAILRPLTGEIGLRPEHLYLADHQAIYAAMVDLHDTGDGVDKVALARRLDQAQARTLAGIVGGFYEADAYRAHAKRILACHRYERVRRSAEQLAAGAAAMDDATIGEAERLLTEPDGHDGALVSPDERQDRALDRLQQTEQPTIPLPWTHINRLIGGGMWPGRYALLGGWTAHGKSCAVDQILEHAAERGKRVAVYLTETTEEERTDRSIARTGGIKLHLVQSREDPAAIAAAVQGMPPVWLVEAHDWTVQEIARHIQHHRWDMCAVDVLHDIQHREERDLAEIGRTLLQVAKRTRTALIANVHLNDNRVTDTPPTPVNRDVRGSGMLVRQADVVLMVFQDEDEDGPTGLGSIKVTKCRQGMTGVMRARFNGPRQRWEHLLQEAA